MNNIVIFFCFEENDVIMMSEDLKWKVDIIL